VLLAVGGYQFATLQNPVVAKGQTRWVGWILLVLGLALGGVVALTLLARRRGAFVPVPSSDALQQAIVELPQDVDPQVVEKMNEIRQRIATMQAQPQRGQITRGQTVGIVIGCAVAVLGALLLRGLH
jgi:beta-lactamase regulating signal transducer with metallopeptidase domain